MSPTFGIRRLSLSGLVLIAAVAAIGFVGAARADTQYFGTFYGQTYRNNYGGSCRVGTLPGQFGSCYQGTWASTTLYAGEQVNIVGVADYGADWQAVYYDPYALYAWVNTLHRCNDDALFPNYCMSPTAFVSTNGRDYDANFAHRAWSEHQDSWTGMLGYTSDGFCGQHNLSPSACP
jgi:hypothetical protein